MIGEPVESVSGDLWPKTLMVIWMPFEISDLRAL
jgi:hypothetical protein